MAFKKSSVLLMVMLLIFHLEKKQCSILTDGEAALNNIGSQLRQSGKDVTGDIKNILAHLKSERDSSKVKTLSSAVVKMNTAVPNLMSSNNLKITTSALAVISAASSVIPVIGPVVGAMFDMVAAILGSIGGSGGSPSDVFSKIVDERFRAYDELQMKSSATSAKQNFDTLYSFMEPLIKSSHVTNHNIVNLQLGTRVTAGVDFLAKVATKAKESAETPGQHRRAMMFVKLYAELTVMQDVFRWILYSICQKAKDSTTSATQVYRVIKKGEDLDKKNLKFLTQPTIKTMDFFSNTNLFDNKWQFLRQLMKDRGLYCQNLVELSGKYHTLTPKRWPNWYMEISNIYNRKRSSSVYMLRGSKKINSYSTLMFRKRGNDNVFTISPKFNTARYVFMYSKGIALDNVINDSSSWKILRLDTGYYVIATKKWPSWFIYMSSSRTGRVDSYKGDPGYQGYWKIN